MFKAGIFVLAFLAIISYVVCQINTGCAACNDNPEIQAFILQCDNLDGKWCNCSRDTLYGSCGACYGIEGSFGGSCTNGLYCGEDMAPCIGNEGGICYSIYANCECEDGKLVCQDKSINNDSKQ